MTREGHVRICESLKVKFFWATRPLSSERYDWVERRSKTTKGFDRYINRQLIHSTVEDVSRKEKISYEIGVS